MAWRPRATRQGQTGVVRTGCPSNSFTAFEPQAAPVALQQRAAPEKFRRAQTGTAGQGVVHLESHPVNGTPSTGYEASQTPVAAPGAAHCAARWCVRAKPRAPAQCSPAPDIAHRHAQLGGTRRGNLWQSHDSTSTTLNPRTAASSATPRPVAPPPMTARSGVVFPATRAGDAAREVGQGGGLASWKNRIAPDAVVGFGITCQAAEVWPAPPPPPHPGQRTLPSFQAWSKVL